MLSEMGQYLEEAEKSRKGQMKKKLLDWGGALDLCARKEEQLRKAERLRKEHRKIWEESDSMDGRSGAFWRKLTADMRWNWSTYGTG